MLDYMYEGYGYDMDNQLLYTDVKKYDEALSENGKMSTNGMETLAYNNGPISHASAIPTEDDNKCNEIASFVSEDGVKYTDLRFGVCGCNKNRPIGNGETIDNNG